jgi:sarcosine oxidase
MGGAALRALARRGAKVCGIERFGIAHDRGSSHGATRIIRKAYFEHPDYVPLLHRAYDLWDELEGATGADLLHRCGFLTCGAPDSETIQGLVRCYGAHDLPHERLEPGDLRRRYPQLSLEGGQVGFLDSLGGYLRVEECVRCLVQEAVDAGAELALDEPVDSWTERDGQVVVASRSGERTASALVLTTGAWAAAELTGLGVAAEVWRKVVFWYPAAEPDRYRETIFPTFYVETDYGHFYGFPAIDERGIKVAEHVAVTPIDDPGAIERQLLPGDELPVRRFLAAVMPGVEPARTAHSVCLYTITPDRHFVVDRHPRHAAVVIGAGFSGHGFKFAPVIGEALADLALEGRSALPIGFLGLDRLRR